MKKRLSKIFACLSIILVGVLALVGCGEEPPADTNIYVSTEEQFRSAVSQNDVSIVLTQDIDLSTAIDISKKVEIDLNNKILTLTNDTEGNGVFHIIEGGDLTINGDGTVNGVGNNKWNIAVFAEGGRVVINGGTYTNIGATGEDPTHYDLIYAKYSGQIIINGGTFTGQTPAWLLNLNDDYRETASITVKGGTFIGGFNPANCNCEGENTNFVADGYQAVEVQGNYVVSKIAE